MCSRGRHAQPFSWIDQGTSDWNTRHFTSEQKARGPCYLNQFEPPSDFTTKEKQSLKKIHQWLSAPMSLLLIEDCNKAMKKLKGAHAKALEFACTEIGCAPATQASARKCTKDDWTTALIAWVSFFFFED